MVGLPNTVVIHPTWDARFRLRHTVTVEPYAGWDDYDTAVEVEALATTLGRRSQRGTSTPVAGTARITELAVYLPADADCPLGSRITLPDGRRGHVAARTARDGGGLAFAGSIETVVIVGEAYGPPFGETVTVLVRGAAERDAAGSVTYTPSQTAVAGCAVRILTSSEAAEVGADTVADVIEVICPPGTAVTAADQVRVRGLVYDVIGTPQVIGDAITDAQPGLRVIGQRTRTV